MNSIDRKKRPILTPSVRKFVSQEALRQRNKPREILAVELKEKIDEMGYPPPNEDTLKRYISQARNHESPLDETWTTGSLKDYELSPLGVQKIYELKAKGLDWINIRTALWISRLANLPLSTDNIYSYAFLYALSEEAHEINSPDKPFDTSDIDKLVTETILNPEEAFIDMGRWDEEAPKEYEEEFYRDIGKRMLQNHLEKRTVKHEGTHSSTK